MVKLEETVWWIWSNLADKDQLDPAIEEERTSLNQWEKFVEEEEALSSSVSCSWQVKYSKNLKIIRSLELVTWKLVDLSK